MDARLAQSAACSCSYSTGKASAAASARQLARSTSLQPCRRGQAAARGLGSSRYNRHVCAARASKPEPSSPAKQQTISGYTPANFVSFSDAPEHTCHHLIGIQVDAPASVCFEIWNDWNRLVEFLDLISQIGLDPDQEDFALFQCFYRWGMLPVLEIVFLLQKTNVEQDKLIQFQTVQGMPASGDVQFVEQDGKTTIVFKLEHQLPNLLVDLNIGVFGVETSCREIFTENLLVFKQLAEGLAKDPGTFVRQEAGDEEMNLGIPLEEIQAEEEELEEWQRRREEEGEGEAEEGEAEGEEAEGEEEADAEDEEGEAEDEQQQTPLRKAAGAAAAAVRAPAARQEPAAPSPSASQPPKQPAASGRRKAAAAEASAAPPRAASAPPAAAPTAAAAGAAKASRARKKAEPEPAASPPAAAAAAPAAGAKARGRPKSTSTKAARAG